MATNVYSSIYTGAQVDKTVEDKTEVLTLDAINKLDATKVSLSKIYIAEDDNTVWRSNGIRMVEVLGSGDAASSVQSTSAQKGDFLVADGKGGSSWQSAGAGVTTITDSNGNNGISGSVKMNGMFNIDTSNKMINLASLPYSTTAPTTDWTGEGIKIVVLDSAPTTYKKGWLYLIKE